MYDRVLYKCTLYILCGYFCRELQNELQGQREESGRLLDEVSQALGCLDDLRDKYVHVATKTNALHDACENLLDEQVKNYIIS